MVWILVNPPDRQNGARPRFLSFAQYLSDRQREDSGWNVHFAVPDSHFFPDDLAALKASGVISGFSRFTTYRARGFRNMLSRILLLPRWRDRMMRREQAQTVAEIREIIRRENAQVCVVSDRGALIALRELRSLVRVVVDWTDSYSLYSMRALQNAIRKRAWRELPNTALDCLRYRAMESYYPKLAHENIVVSPVDSSVFQRLCGGSASFKVLLNGVDVPGISRREKVRNRMIFSGRMDFPPNHEAALWFIQSVLPLVLESCPDAQFVVAGAKPIPALLQLSGPSVRVTGFVEDMAAEIAQAEVYVAPLVSGGGFKNKVFEAIAAGTFVVGTPMASEFLPEGFSRVVKTAQTPREFADLVVSVLRSPGQSREALETAKELLRNRYSWTAQAREFEKILDGPGGVPRSASEFRDDLRR